jgi:hypothetical protein
MEFATDGYLRATRHRVVSPPVGETRLSIPFFVNPALDSTVPRIPLPPELARESRGISQDPDDVISGTFGDNLLKARLRAHPDVAAVHHPDLLGSGRGSVLGLPLAVPFQVRHHSLDLLGAQGAHREAGGQRPQVQVADVLEVGDQVERLGEGRSERDGAVVGHERTGAVAQRLEDPGG